MDEDFLGAALHRATDDVEVPRDLVRQAHRLGRERRARRRTGVVALGVAALVLAGGGLVVTSQQGGNSATGDSAAGAASSAEGGAGLDGPASAEPGSQPSAAAPESMQDAAHPGGDESATCTPTLVIRGVPQGVGSAATSVRAGEVLDVAGESLSCEGVVPGARYDVVLAPQRSGEPVVLAGVTVAEDGSFVTRVTVPSSTPTGPAALSVRASGTAAQVCPSAAACQVPDHRAALDVRPAGESP